MRKVGFIGCGNLAQTIIAGWLGSGHLQKDQIFATNRTEKKLDRVVELYGINPLNTNEELIETCDVIILATKPQDLGEAIEPLSSAFDDSKIVVSLAAGIDTDQLKKFVSNTKHIFRVMLNTAVAFNKGTIGFCSAEENDVFENVIENLFKPLGKVFKVSEGEAFQAFTVATSSGIGLLYELMLYWQEWLLEYDFSPEVAREMTVQAFEGASLIAQEKSGTPLEELQKKVASKKGVTAAGLNSMRELEIERLLRYSFEKAILRDKELGKA